MINDNVKGISFFQNTLDINHSWRFALKIYTKIWLALAVSVRILGKATPLASLWVLTNGGFLIKDKIINQKKTRQAGQKDTKFSLIKSKTDESFCRYDDLKNGQKTFVSLFRLRFNNY